jgi:hypothetical protein
MTLLDMHEIETISRKLFVVFFVFSVAKVPSSAKFDGLFVVVAIVLGQSSLLSLIQSRQDDTCKHLWSPPLFCAPMYSVKGPPSLSKENNPNETHPGGKENTTIVEYRFRCVTHQPL